MPTPQTPKLAPGDKAPDFDLPNQNRDAAGDTVSLEGLLSGKRGAVILWMCNHCPYVVGSVERLKTLAEDTKAAGVAWAAICSNDPVNYPEDAPGKMVEYSKKWKLPFAYLFDETQEVARAYGVERTPEIFLIDAHGVCVYEGALDDSPKDPAAVTDRPLKDAIEDLLAGRKIRRPQTHAIGCSIKWRA